MKNAYEIRGDVTAIFLRRRDGTILETLIDTPDLGRASSIAATWFAATKGPHSYAQSHIGHGRKRRTLTLHRLLCEPPPDAEIDHRNHNGLDNRRMNLYVTDVSGNQLNRRGPTRRNSCGVLGVNWYKRTRQWVARICIQGKRIFVGCFRTKEAAGSALQVFRSERDLPC